MSERSDRHAGRDGSVSGASPRGVPEFLRSPDARRANAELSLAGGRFLEFVAHNPECLDPGSFTALEGKAELAPYPLQPWPTFVAATNAAAAAETNARLCSLVKSLPERVFDDDPAHLASYFRLDPRYAKLITVLLRREDYVAGLVVRGDYLNTADGMRCLELNFGGNLGGWMVPSIVGRYRDVPLLERFVQESAVSWTYRDVPRLFFAHILERARRAGRLRDGELRIAFVVPPEWRSGVVSLEYSTSALGAVLEEHAPEIRGEVVVCDATELTAEPGGLVYQDRRVQAVSEQTFERTAGSVARALLAGAVDVYNGPATDVFFDKRNLALLSERQGSDLFDREERALIAAHVPWTREVSDADTTWEGERARLSDVLSEFRERLVLKPAIGTQGRGVQIGRRLSAPAWEAAVAAALSSADPWVVQEHVESLPYLYLDPARGCCEHDVVWGLYAFGDSDGGSFLRLMSKDGGSGVVNSAQGATEGLIMEVEA